jgi:excisionase family DNA binding protein
MKSDIPIEREALSIEQACAVASLGKTKFYEIVAAGTLKTRRLGRRRLILVTDLRSFLRSLPTK